MITAVVTVHGRLWKLQQTLASLAAASNNITEVVITATGLSPKDQRRFLNLSKTYKKVYNTNPYSNAAWIAGVTRATNPLVLLIHDGDVVLPSFNNQKFCPSAVTLYCAGNITGDLRYKHDECCVSGFPTSKDDLLRLLSRPNTKTISPLRGVFPKELMLRALTAFEEYYTPSLLVNDSLAVGNDLLLWLTAARSNYPLETITRVLVAFDIEDSTTVRADATKYHKLEKLYDAVRVRAATQYHRPTVTMLYRSELDRLPEEHFKNCVEDVSPAVTFRHTLFPMEQIPQGITRSNYIGAMAFTTAVHYAHNYGYQWLLYVEDDCRLKPGFARAMIEEFAKDWDVFPLKLFYGTPIVWNPSGPGRYFFERYIRYAKNYYDYTGFNLAPQGNLRERTAIYVNGALAIYDAAFTNEILHSQALRNPAAVCPWDLILGYYMYDMFRERAFDYIVPSSVSYSDGDFQHLPQAARTWERILAWHK